MPEANGSPITDPRTISALGERVAVVETKVTLLKEDTGVIRTTLHAVNNEMQRFVMVEQQCSNSLAQLVSLTKELPAIADYARDFINIRPALIAMIEEHQQRKGAWGAVVIAGSVIVGCATIGGGIASLVLWLFGRIH